MAAARPVGKITAVSVEHERRPNTHATYVKVNCEDEAGQRWFFSASCFNFDLMHIIEKENDHGQK